VPEVTCVAAEASRHAVAERKAARWFWIEGYAEIDGKAGHGVPSLDVERVHPYLEVAMW